MSDVKKKLIDALDRYLRQDETAGDTDNGVYRQGQEAMAAALTSAPAEPPPKIDWAVRTLRAIANRGRAELGDSYPEIVSVWAALHDIGASAETPPAAAPAAEVVALMRFYSVDSADALIAAQGRHIEKLQSKLQPAPSLAPQRVREG